MFLKLYAKFCSLESKYNTNISPIESEKLKELAPAPNIPIDQLRAQIASFRQVNIDNKQSWIYIVGDGSGSGFLLLVVMFGCLYWKCKNSQSPKARSPIHVTDTDPENPNMMYTREDTIRSDRRSELGHKTIGFQDPVSDMDQVVDVRMQHAFSKAVLDQLEANSTNVRRNCRKLRKKQYAAVPAIEY